MKPRVFQSRPTNGPAEWVVFCRDTSRWFPTWREAYAHAYLLGRIRNVVIDVFEEIP